MPIGRILWRGVASRAARNLLWRASRNGNYENLIIRAGGLYLVDVAGECDFLSVRRDRVEVRAAKIERRYIVISGSEVDRSASLERNHEEMAALKACVTRPMTVEKARKYLGFHFGFGEFFVASLVACVIFATGIHL